MPQINVLESDKALMEVQAVYLDFHRPMSFPAAPNIIKVQGHSPTVVRGTWDLVRNVLVTGQVSRIVKEMMFVAISKDRGCLYCEAAHIACCRMLGIDQRVLGHVVENILGLPDAKSRDIILFGLKCSRDPRGLEESDFASLRRHGLRDSEIVEVIAMAGMAVYANIMADATGVEADGMFEEIRGV
jgi:uncharacterized peroxidase-related enzyme